ncbi:orotidine-5'-phosphate decarboxylase [Aminipila luticellarii]|uniref:Orotidine 5'-phosphate decarboxylase n=1 Tax=Aminipila luticellarii TaxID=2507160 RepID=A0A410PYN3_9FIRM|nr:orotidine-5'-phosphate decarboxylase [Aminipila luticellarii]
MDTLLKKIDAMKNPTVVGLDPTLEMIPEPLQAEMFEKYGKTPDAVGSMFIKFNKEIIDSVADIVPAVKPQIAMYEKYGVEGIRAYLETIEYAREKGMTVIGDIKRGDISSTAAAYAAHIEGTEIAGEEFDLWKEDWITINPYLGIDGIQPFIDACNKKDKGVFVLVKTSNPSSSQIQDIVVKDKTIYEMVAELVKEWGTQSMGTMGYSRIGAVVGATHKEQGAHLRKIMPHTFFLVPGYGAQGGTGADLKGFFDKDGRGCIVNSSRGITAAYKKNNKYGERAGEAARAAALAMKADLQY